MPILGKKEPEPTGSGKSDRDKIHEGLITDPNPMNMEDLKVPDPINYDSAASDVKGSHVSVEIESLDNMIIITDKVLSELEAKLNNILLFPEPPSEQEDQKKSELVPLAHRIRAIRYKVVACNKSIDDLLARLQN